MKLNVTHLLNDKLRLVSAGILLCLLFSPLASISASLSEEYKIKSALIYKISKFVDWPEMATTNANTFNICLLGRDDFKSSLDALEQRNVKDLPVTIKRFSQSDTVERGCHVMFVSSSKKQFIKNIIEKFSDQPILMISDIKDFSEQGGMIELTSGNRLGFKINLKSAKSSGLDIAAPLLQLSTVVDK